MKQSHLELWQTLWTTKLFLVTLQGTYEALKYSKASKAPILLYKNEISQLSDFCYNLATYYI